MTKEPVPSISFYDQDFVDLYDRTWKWIETAWTSGDKKNGMEGNYVSYEGQSTFNLYNTCISSLFLNYSNGVFSPFKAIDYFYEKQEEDGAIRSDYSVEDGRPVLTLDNPQGLSIPILAFMEFSFYHKLGNKNRLKDVLPYLEKYFDWLRANFMKDGLFCVPAAACGTGNIPRQKTAYPIDFNIMMAVNALFMGEIGDILNDNELVFKYRKLYFLLKTKINDRMWDDEKKFYFDLDADGNRLTDCKMLSGLWSLLAELPNEEQASTMVEYLKDPNVFGTENPFPTVSVDSPCFRENVVGYCGAVVAPATYWVLKGLEKYGYFVFARECAIRHIYFMLDTLNPEEGKVGDAWEAYLPGREGIPARIEGDLFPRKRFLPSVALVTITLMIENVIGLEISLPKKTVDWTVPSLETMGISNLSLKRNMISIVSNKNIRGWEIRLESEKLYYFTINVLDEYKKKTLPIPSGKCSMLIDKL